mgnify:CR=1 FL=1
MKKLLAIILIALLPSLLNAQQKVGLVMRKKTVAAKKTKKKK